MLKCVYIPITIHTRELLKMRTNIVIDDDLMNDAIRLTGVKTKREAVEIALKSLITLKKQENIKGHRGKLKWEGDLDDMRSDK